MQISLWLKDGSVYKNARLLSSSITIEGQPMDVNSLDKIDDAYLYTVDGAQIYRDRVGGGIQIALAGVSGGLPISIDQIADLERAG